MGMIFFVVLAECLFRHAAAAGGPAESPLSRWLWKLKIPIPEIEVREGGYDIVLKETVCTHFGIGSIASSDRSTEASMARVNATIDGIDLECSGLWKYHATNKMKRPKASGELSARVKSSSARASLTVGGEFWPTYANLPECSTSITLKLDFKGSSLSAAILQILEKAISGALSSTLNAELCGWIEPLVQVNLTQIIRKGDDALTECLETCRRRDREMLADAVGQSSTSPRHLSAFAAVSSSLATCAIQQMPTVLRLKHLDRQITMRTDYGNVTFALVNASATVHDIASSTLRLFPEENPLIGTQFFLPGSTNLSADLLLSVVADESSSSATTLQEAFSFSWPLSNISLASDTELALRSLWNISLGALAEAPAACAAQAVVALNETRINATARFGPPKLLPHKMNHPDSSLESDLDAFANVILSAFFRAFPDTIDAVVDCGVDGIVKTLLDRALVDVLKPPPPDSRCEAGNSSSYNDLVQWDESKVLRLVDSLLTANTLNFATTCLEGDDEPASHFVDVSLLSGIGGSTLQSKGALDSVKVSLSLGNSATIKLDADSFAWILDARVAAVAAEWYDITVGDLLLGDQCTVQAALSTAPRIERVSINSSNVLWNVTGLGDRSRPVSKLLDQLVLALEEIGSDYSPQFLDFINRQLEARHSELVKRCSHSSSHKQKTTPNRKHFLLGIAIFIVVCAAATIFYQILLVVLQARRRRRSSWYSSSNSQRGRLRARRSEGVEESKTSPLPDDDLFQEEPLLLFGSGGGTSKGHRSLATSENVHWCARCLVPLLLCFNIGLFIWSNSTPGASVDLELILFENASGIGPITINLGSVFKFSLANSVRDMWNAGVYPLSVLIALCSGGWPYLKLVTMFVCWLAPSSRKGADDDDEEEEEQSCVCLPERRVLLYLSPQKRETLLIWLDALGKWSLVDTFVMTMMLVAFHFKVKVGFAYGGGDFVDACIVNVYVVALPSFFVFVAATCLSLVLGHVILAFHRRDMRLSSAAAAATARGVLVSPHPLPPSPKKTGRRAALFKHEFYVKDQRSVGRSQLSFSIRYGVIVSLVATLALLCYGASEDGFDFQMRGLTGWIMGDTDANEKYSIVSLGASVSRSSKHPRSLGAIVLTVVYFAYALAFPVLLLPTLLFLWILPLRLDRMRAVYYVCEVVNAWAALDVFMVAIIACITEISQFAAFMVGDKCDTINKFLKRYLDKQLDGDDKCFDVVTELKRGAWLLFVASFVSWFLSQYILRCAHEAIEERKRRDGEDEEEEEEESSSRVVERRAEDTVSISLSPSSSLRAASSSTAGSRDVC